MVLVPPPPNPSVPVAVPIHSLDREYYLLRVLAKTFEFELERERQLQLEGRASLPPEWFAYLKRERQQIQEKLLHSTESRDTLDNVQVSDPLVHPSTPQALFPITAPRSEGAVGVCNGRNILHPTQSIGESGKGWSYTDNMILSEGTLAHPTSCIVPKKILVADPRSLSNAATFGAGDSLSPQGLHSFNSLTVHARADTGGFNNHKRIHKSSVDALEPSCIEGSASSLQIVNTHPNPKGMERVGDQSPAGMFNSAQHTTIHGGVFFLVQGNVSNVWRTPFSL